MSLRTIESLRRVELSTTFVTPQLETLGAVAAQGFAKAVEIPVELMPLNFSQPNLGPNERSFLHRQEVAEQDLAFISDALFYAKPGWESDLPPELRWVPVAKDLLKKNTDSRLEDTRYFTDEDMVGRHASAYRGFMKRVTPAMPHGMRTVMYAKQVADGSRTLRPAPQRVLH